MRDETADLTLPQLLGRVADFTEDVILITEAEPFDLPGPRIVYVNEAFTRMTGYAPEEVLGRTPRLLQGPRTDPAANRRIRQALQAWQPIRIELLNYRKDGSEFWVELSITPVADESGWYRYWVAVQRETSERHRFDEQQRLNQLILDNISEGILVADAQRLGHPIEFANAGFTAMTGYRLEDMLGGGARLLQGEGSHADARALLRRAIEHGEPVTTEILNYRKGGEPFWNQMSITPLRNEYGEVIKLVGVQRDVTQARQREHDVVSAQRLRAVGEMTGGIAHDFNNLLTAISGAAELLGPHTRGRPEVAALVDTIRGAAERGTSQVRRLLAFSRTPLLARGAVDLAQVLQQLQSLLRASLRDHIALQLTLAPDARWVNAEAVQMESAVLNLVLNAQDALPGGGRIDVSTVRRGAWVDLSVQDNGTGMDEATRAQIFEAFFTTKAPGRGSGLGLAMVHAFVAQLGGRIEVRSAPGAGSTFVLSLPVAEAPPPCSSPAPDDAVHPTSPCHVLLVEDDDVVRITSASMLRALGHRVTEAPDADVALPLLESDPSVDVLLTDMLMPGSLAGRELAQRARRLRPSLAIVLSSGWADSDLPAASAPQPHEQFLLKPYSLADLRRAIGTARARA